jgi:AhpD family alkylhydroperoxidase
MSELIAVAIAICTGCEGCIAYHLEEAVRAGATREEALAVLAVALAMGGGPAAVYGGKALRMIDGLLDASASGASAVGA